MEGEGALGFSFLGREEETRQAARVVWVNFDLMAKFIELDLTFVYFDGFNLFFLHTVHSIQKRNPSYTRIIILMKLM